MSSGTQNRFLATAQAVNANLAKMKPEEVSKRINDSIADIDVRIGTLKFQQGELDQLSDQMKKTSISLTAGGNLGPGGEDLQTFKESVSDMQKNAISNTQKNNAAAIAKLETQKQHLQNFLQKYQKDGPEKVAKEYATTASSSARMRAPLRRQLAQKIPRTGQLGGADGRKDEPMAEASAARLEKIKAILAKKTQMHAIDEGLCYSSDDDSDCGCAATTAKAPRTAAPLKPDTFCDCDDYCQCHAPGTAGAALEGDNNFFFDASAPGPLGVPLSDDGFCKCSHEELENVAAAVSSRPSRRRLEDSTLAGTTLKELW